MSSNVARACEPLRHIDAGPICQRNDYTDTRYRHQAATYSIIASRCPRHAIKTAELIQEHTAHPQQRLGNRSNIGVHRDELDDPGLEGALGHLAQPQPKDFERATH